MSCDLIREGAPIPPEPPISPKHWNPEPHVSARHTNFGPTSSFLIPASRAQLFFVEGGRIEAGFRQHVHRADATSQEEEIDVLVCHGNVIRYFVCRALQFPPDAWLK